MPVDLPPAQPKHPECAVEFIDDRLYPNDENLTVGFNGFARIRLDGNRMTVNYVDVDGAVIFSESWIVESGVLRRVKSAHL
jgi:hypothetical protein